MIAVIGRLAARSTASSVRDPSGPAAAAADADPLAVRSYVAHLRAEGLSKASVGRHLSALRTFFAFLKIGRAHV